MKRSSYSWFFAALSLLFSQVAFSQQPGLAKVINISGDSEHHDRLGEVVATGDFNCDGYDDLAIGVPGEDNDRGAINIVYGSGSKLTATGNKLFKQGAFTVAESGDRFGAALATGDFDGDDCDDLAIGIPGEDIGSDTDAGGVAVVYGGPGGISTFNFDLWSQDSSGVGGGAEAYDGFGSSLATGDFDDDGYADLAIGVPYEGVSSTNGVSVGAVNILYGGSSGLSASGNQVLTAAGTAHFGFSLATGDFDGDGYDDLAIGVPLDGSNSGYQASGSVNVLYGSAGKLSTSNGQWWRQDAIGVVGVAYPTEYFGHSLAVGDFDGDGYDDLAVGVPGDGILHNGDIYIVGGVNVLYGSGAGLSADGDELWNAEVFGEEQPLVYNELGSALAAGDFNGDNRDDLVIGIPRSKAHPAASGTSGRVRVIYGSANGLVDEGQQIHQDTSGVLNEADQRDRFGYALAVGNFNGGAYDDLVVGVPLEDYAGNTLTDSGIVQVFYGTIMGVYPPVNQLFVQ